MRNLVKSTVLTHDIAIKDLVFHQFTSIIEEDIGYDINIEAILYAYIGQSRVYIPHGRA